MPLLSFLKMFMFNNIAPSRNIPFKPRSRTPVSSGSYVLELDPALTPPAFVAVV